MATEQPPDGGTVVVVVALVVEVDRVVGFAVVFVVVGLAVEVVPAFEVVGAEPPPPEELPQLHTAGPGTV